MYLISNAFIKTAYVAFDFTYFWLFASVNTIYLRSALNTL